jgi:phage-related minor tail protein
LTATALQEAVEAIQSFSAFQKAILEKSAGLSNLKSRKTPTTPYAMSKKISEKAVHENLEREKREKLEREKQKERERKERDRHDREEQERARQEKEKELRRAELERKHQEEQERLRAERARKEREAEERQRSKEQEDKENRLKRQQDESQERRNSKKQKMSKMPGSVPTSPKAQPLDKNKPLVDMGPAKVAKPSPLINMTNVAVPSPKQHKPGGQSTPAFPYSGSQPKQHQHQQQHQQQAAQPSQPQSGQKSNPPSWARSAAISEALAAQTIDPDEVFAPLSGVDLEVIFGPAFLKHKRPRTSSANWAADRYTPEEEHRYKRELGYIK